MVSSRDVVLAFVAGVALCERALLTEFTEVSREMATTPLEGLTRDGTRRRSGRIEGFGNYRFHGRGCAFELDSGEYVDFDWRARVTEFDPWRLRLYAESVGVTGVDKHGFLAACRGLVSEGLLAEGEYDFFHVAPRADGLGDNG